MLVCCPVCVKASQSNFYGNWHYRVFSWNIQASSPLAGSYANVNMNDKHVHSQELSCWLRSDSGYIKQGDTKTVLSQIWPLGLRINWMTAHDQCRGKLCFPSVLFYVWERGRLQRVEFVKHLTWLDEICHPQKKKKVSILLHRCSIRGRKHYWLVSHQEAHRIRTSLSTTSKVFTTELQCQRLTALKKPFSMNGDTCSRDQGGSPVRFSPTLKDFDEPDCWEPTYMRLSVKLQSCYAY